MAARVTAGLHAPQAGATFLHSSQLPRAMPEVIIHDDESFERALKRFKKKCEKAGILSDLRKHRHYEKPSERRKRKMNAARRKNRPTRPA
jgi:small subunit ribosomal protein S21